MITNTALKTWFAKDRKHNKKELTRILNVEYAHLLLKNRDDLYVTQYGIECLENLKPQNHFNDERWFEKNSERLSGTSSVYRVRTKKIGGKYKDLVIKWNRMGQEIPGGNETEMLRFASFNSPFEEFSLVMELRDEIRKSKKHINLQKPLAIYVPREKVDLWETGRKEFEMASLIKKHEEVQIDMHRMYAVIYEWLPGMDLGRAVAEKKLKKKFIRILAVDAHKQLDEIGYVVKDAKADHVIMKPNREGGCNKYKNGDYKYGLVDFELLARTPQRERMEIQKRRMEYLRRQKERFTVEYPGTFHPHLKHVSIMGVDYIYGKVESTKGSLWVVGKDPYLFDYFLPERWMNEKKTKISTRYEIYHTVTKDNIHLVWRASNVGFVPDMDPFNEDEKRILDHGYNSPFEEFFLAVELNKMGIRASYPRAIYMTGNEIEIPKELLDKSRFKSHADFKRPDGKKVLQKNREYIKIWGYWNGPDEMLANKDGDYHKGINALQAYRRKIITKKQYIGLMKKARKKLAYAGIEDLSLRGTHILISIDSNKNLVKDPDGTLEIRFCNFAFLKVM